MAQPHHQLVRYTLKTAYWLSLPIIGIGIWLIITWMSDWVLSNASRSASQLQTNFYPTTQLARTLTVTSIHANIDRHNNIAEVTLTTANSTLERLEFKFPFSGTTALETALAEKLNTSSDTIQSLIQYRIE